MGFYGIFFLDFPWFPMIPLDLWIKIGPNRLRTRTEPADDPRAHPFAGWGGHPDGSGGDNPPAPPREQYQGFCMVPTLTSKMYQNIIHICIYIFNYIYNIYISYIHIYMHQWGSYEVILFTPFRRKTCLLKAKFSDVPAEMVIACHCQWSYGSATLSLYSWRHSV